MDLATDRPAFHPIRVIISTRGTTTRLSLLGDIDLVNRLTLEEAIDAAASCGGGAVDLDFAAVDSLDAAAIGSVVASSERLRSLGVRLTISNVPPRIQPVIEGSALAAALIANHA
jgi:anti-anti-sigma factor